MKKNKFFSGALFAENLRRFWPVSVVGLFIYFLSGPFLILTKSVRDNYLYGSVLNGTAGGAMLNNLNFGFLFVHLVLPVVAAVCVFSYLNRVGSVAALHSMPLSRRTLFVTNYLSGLALCVLPVVINWALLSLCGAGLKAFTASALGMWLLVSFTIALFMFSVAVLACVVSGNTVIATLTGFALGFLVPAVWVCMYAYAESFLYGFEASDIWPQITLTNPWLRTIYCGFTIEGTLKAWHCLVYIAVAIVIAIAADILYHVRKLERCGDSYVFGWMQTIIGFLFAFAFSTMTGLVLFRGIGVWAYVIGFAIGFVLGQMISLKTFHLFSRKTLRNLIIFAVLMALIIGAFALDVFGFEKKVPDPKNVQSVSIEGIWTGSAYRAVTFRTGPSVENAAAFHREILEQRPDEVYEIMPARHSHFALRYDLKNGMKLTRQYSVESEFVARCESFTKLLQSEEMTGSITGLASIQGEKDFYVMREFPFGVTEAGGFDNRSFSGAEGEALLNALVSDAKAGKMTTAWARQPLYSVEMTVRRGFSDKTAAQEYFSSFYGFAGIDSYDGQAFIGRFSFQINGDCKDTLEFFEKAGFGVTAAPGADRLIGVIFGSEEAEGNHIFSLDYIPQSEEGMAVLSPADMLRATVSAGYSGKVSESCRWMSVCDTQGGGCVSNYTMYIDIEKLPADIKSAVEPYVK